MPEIDVNASEGFHAEPIHGKIGQLADSIQAHYSKVRLGGKTAAQIEEEIKNNNE